MFRQELRIEKKETAALEMLDGEGQRDLGAIEVKVTEGLFTFVALDANHRPRAVDQSS